MNLLASFVVLFAGLSLALQQVLNAGLGNALQSARWAAFASYLGGTIALLLVLAALREPIPAGPLAGRAPLIAWTGGIFGAIFIVTSIFMVPRLGVATVLTLIVVGQLLGSLAFDHIGMLGLPQHPVSLTRALGAGCLVLGAALVRG
ncbi:DMT family transporter [Bradyrhizobium xenonodulans]|uniref:DMT family transporter n=1 Tax=Bradyrhizobium xenonodulans TaxID=2736875 RepID=A0ABY7MC21_9BRAD|nr:DMT family transporter [Bradyrhizobium xenonodulans]WBL75863.1 DMT family transporter [Bradyrhizobium xenonodulans]